MTIVIIRERDSYLFQSLIDIYQAAIEPSEQKPAEALAAALEDNRYRLTALLDRGEVVGFTIGFSPQAAEFWLLEYMAVRQDRRNRGLGVKLFREAAAAHADKGRPLTLLEVDAVTGNEQEIVERKRRLLFYDRLGCRSVRGLDYILPLNAASFPPPMLILTYSDPPLELASRERVKGWIDQIYTEVYQTPLSDPRRSLMFAAAPDYMVIAPILIKVA